MSACLHGGGGGVRVGGHNGAVEVGGNGWVRVGGRGLEEASEGREEEKKKENTND